MPPSRASPVLGRAKILTSIRHLDLTKHPVALILVHQIVVFMADSSEECTNTVGQVEELRDPALLQPDLAKVWRARLLLLCCICEKGKQAETVTIHAFFVAAGASSNLRGQRKTPCLG